WPKANDRVRFSVRCAPCEGITPPPPCCAWSPSPVNGGGSKVADGRNAGSSPAMRGRGTTKWWRGRYGENLRCLDAQEAPVDFGMVRRIVGQNDLAAAARAAKTCEEQRFLHLRRQFLTGEFPAFLVARRGQHQFAAAVLEQGDVGMEMKPHDHPVAAIGPGDLAALAEHAIDTLQHL